MGLPGGPPASIRKSCGFCSTPPSLSAATIHSKGQRSPSRGSVTKLRRILKDHEDSGAMSAFMAPESSWSLRIRLSLVTEPLEGDLWPFEWIVAALKLGGVEQNPQDLRIDAGGPPGKPIQRGKHEQAAHQAAKKIERRRAHDAGEKKE